MQCDICIHYASLNSENSLFENRVRYAAQNIREGGRKKTYIHTHTRGGKRRERERKEVKRGERGDEERRSAR